MLTAFVGFLASQIEMRRDLSEFKHLSQTDPSTGAHNRNSFAVKSAALWMDWITLGKPFSFAMVDLDHFKLVNDTMGHSVGDLVLCERFTGFNHNCVKVTLSCGWAERNFVF